MSAQLSYNHDQEIGIPGQLADSGANDVLSRIAEDDIIPFGRVVVNGTNKDTQAKLPAASTDITNALKVLGVALHSHARESSKNDTQTGYKKEDTASVLHKGRVYVEAEEAMTPESSIYVRYSGKKQVQTITWDGDFVTSNTVNGKVNGSAISQVTFASDQATTIAAVAAAIKAGSNDIESATVTDTREITVTSVLDKEVTISDFVVAAGASQAVDTIAETVARVLSSERGKIRTDADSSSAAQLANARLLSSASGAGAIVTLELNP